MGFAAHGGLTFVVVVVFVVVDVLVEVGLVIMTSTIHEIGIIASNSYNVHYICTLLSEDKKHKYTS